MGESLFFLFVLCSLAVVIVYFRAARSKAQGPQGARNRRRFSRVPFSLPATLFLPDGEVAVEILDVSLKGLSVRASTPLPLDAGSTAILHALLDDGSRHLRITVTMMHQRDGICGLATREIDLESVTHLRRMLELNLANQSVVDRELALLAPR